MPLRDHFHPPLRNRLGWTTLHSAWASFIANSLNDRWLPPQYVAGEHTHAGRLEIDIAAWEETEAATPPAAGVNGGPSVATLPAPAWAPPMPALSFDAAFPDAFEVRVFNNAQGQQLVGVIELVSPSNKDRPEERQAFAAKCAGFLAQGVSVVVVDIVTERLANLHNEISRLVNAPDAADMPAEVSLYAAAYRPVLRGEKPMIDIWTEPLAVGSPLPTMPLRLIGDLFVPVELDATYEETCRRRRLT
jgi:hypothetical protein